VNEINSSIIIITLNINIIITIIIIIMIIITMKAAEVTLRGCWPLSKGQQRKQSTDPQVC
jgi:hypothetical protein